MARIIALVNQKGGVGKTTSALNIASFLALEGQTVLLVDMDPQANATSGLGVNPRLLDRGVYEAITGEHLIRNVVFQTDQDTMHLAPSTIHLAGATVELVNEEQREFKLDSALADVSPYYDYIIIDCPPALGLLTINALVAAREIIIPVQAEYFALEGLSQLLDTITLIQQNLQPQLHITGAFLTMVDKRNALAHEVMRELHDHFPGVVFNTVIPRNVALAEAPSHGKPIALYKRRSRGGKAYQALTNEIIDVS